MEELRKLITKWKKDSSDYPSQSLISITYMECANELEAHLLGRFSEVEKKREHNCEDEFPITGFCKDGERRECSCGKVYEHVCDEAEGCAWFLRKK